MNFTGDFHTHTVYSHGKGTIEENVKAASDKGLRSIAITDHGFGHLIFPMKRHLIAQMRKEIDVAQSSYPNVRVLLGVEANLIDIDGHIDLLQEDFQYLDIILCGYHKMVKNSSIKDVWNWVLPTYISQIFGTSQKAIQRNTEIYTKAISNYPIDVITHLNHDICVDAPKVAEACAKHGTYLELNAKKTTLDDVGLMREIIATGVRFIVNSDAHHPQKVGDFSAVLPLIEKHAIPLERIVNLDLHNEEAIAFRSSKKEI